MRVSWAARLRGTKNWSLPGKSLALSLAGSWCPKERGYWGGGQMLPALADLQEGSIKASRTASLCQLGSSLAFCVLVTLQRNCSWVSSQH